MRLTQYSDYSLRVLMYLGLRDGELCTIRDIAERYAISENHLMKVVHGLAKLGFVRTERGRNGGLRLARRPDAISIGAVVRRTEDDFALVECMNPTSNECPITDACVLRHVLGEAREAFFDALDNYRLSDLLRPAKRLAGLLDLPAA